MEQDQFINYDLATDYEPLSDHRILNLYLNSRSQILIRYSNYLNMLAADHRIGQAKSKLLVQDIFGDLFIYDDLPDSQCPLSVFLYLAARIRILYINGKIDRGEQYEYTEYRKSALLNKKDTELAELLMEELRLKPPFLAAATQTGEVDDYLRHTGFIPDGLFDIVVNKREVELAIWKLRREQQLNYDVVKI